MHASANRGTILGQPMHLRRHSLTTPPTAKTWTILIHPPPPPLQALPVPIPFHLPIHLGGADHPHQCQLRMQARQLMAKWRMIKTCPMTN